MSRTYRNLSHFKWFRTPKHKGKLASGIPRKQVTTDFDDKPIAARKEIWKADKP